MTDRGQRALNSALYIVVATFVLAGLIWAAFGRELYPGQFANSDPARREWFRSLKMPGSGGSCCDISDCDPTDLIEIRGNNYWANLQGTWVMIPTDRIITDPNIVRTNPTGSAIVCWNKLEFQSVQKPDASMIRIFCFVQGAGG